MARMTHEFRRRQPLRRERKFARDRSRGVALGVHYSVSSAYDGNEAWLRGRTRAGRGQSRAEKLSLGSAMPGWLSAEEVMFRKRAGGAKG